MSDQRKILTTGQIAKLLGCDRRTVAKLIDERKLPGFTVPPATPHAHRRVTFAAFDQFCRDHEIVIDGRYASGSELPLGDDDDDPTSPCDPPPVAEAALGADELRRAA